MEYSLNHFLEEFQLDRRFAIDEVDLFRTRLLRRAKKYAIVDVEYFWENPEMLEKAKAECYAEFKAILYHYQELEEYELCQVVVDEEHHIDKLYMEIYLSKMDQMTNANMDEIF